MRRRVRRLLQALERIVDAGLGYTPEELLAEPHVNFVHLEDREATIAQLASLRTGGLMNSFEDRYRCKEGAYKWLLWTAIAKPDEEIIYAVARDNTNGS